MATRLYFHVATNALSNLPTTEQSTNTSAGYNLNPLTTNFLMDQTIGTAQVVRPTSGFSSVVGKTYIGRWVSPTLGVSQIDANTWTINFAATDSGSNSYPVSGSGKAIIVCAYVWRPGTGKVANIIDSSTGNTSTTFQVGSTTEKVEHGTFSGSQVTGVQNTDVVCIELWCDTTGAGSGWAYGIYFDGTTVNTTGAATVSNHAAFLETPQAIFNLQVAKSLTETVSVSDSAAITLRTKNRTATETVTISDNLKGHYMRSLEAITVSDSAARTVTHGGNNVVKTISQTVTVSDALAILRNKKRTVTETIAIAGTPTRLTGKTRSITETVSTTGTLARAKGKVKTLTETVSTTGTTVVRLANKIRVLTDTISIAGTPTRQLSKIRSVSQTVSISDAIARLKGAVRVNTNTISISDQSSRLASKIRPITQTITIADNVARSITKLVSKSITQTVSISDSLTRTNTKIRAISQTVTVSDSLTKLMAKVRVISQTITISDNVARTVSLQPKQIVKTITETIAISDNAARTIAKIRAITESVSTTGTTVSRLAAKIRLISQSITISDLAAKSANKQRSITQSISISDLANRLSGKVRSVTEIASVSDAVNYQTSVIRNIVRIITETRIAISDACYKAREIIESTIHVSDLLTLLKTDNTPTNFNKSLTDTITTSATVVKQANKTRPSTETINISDSAAITNRGKVRVNTENITVTGVVSCQKSLRVINKSLTETVSVTDAISRKADKVRKIGGGFCN